MLHVHAHVRARVCLLTTASLFHQSAVCGCPRMLTGMYQKQTLVHSKSFITSLKPSWLRIFSVIYLTENSENGASTSFFMRNAFVILYSYHPIWRKLKASQAINGATITTLRELSAKMARLTLRGPLYYRYLAQSRRFLLISTSTTAWKHRPTN